jgi:predicted dienelactone hydrolase
VPRPPAGSESALRLRAGPYRVASARIVLHDRARRRTLPSRVWWPSARDSPAPLLVQMHGFLSNRSGGAYLGRHLASRGWVVIAATEPRTTLCARGGARVDDVMEQPGDVRFLIDRMLARTIARPDLPSIDATRIAVMGHSLGGLGATLAAFHPRLRDPRIAAAVSVAGPLVMFEPAFFRTAPVAFLVIAGSADVIVDPRRNALVALEQVPDATVVSIAGASHAGFDEATAGLVRLMDDPDVVGCWVLRRTLHLDAALARLRRSVQPGDGIDLGAVRAPCTEPPPPVTMDPARQQMIATLAVTAFLESRFAQDAATRDAARRFLATTLPHDLPEVNVTASATSHSAIAGRLGTVLCEPRRAPPCRPVLSGS